MQREYIDDLKDALSHALLQTSYDSNGYTEVHQFIRKMAGIITADPFPRLLVTILKNNPVPGFSWEHWLVRMVEEGVYDDSILAAQPLGPDEPDDAD